jgi:hypothetical protein
MEKRKLLASTGNRNPNTRSSSARFSDCTDLNMLRSTKRSYTSQIMYVQRNNEAHSCNHCYNGKETSITYSECVFVALVIQHAKLMRRIILSPAACPALQYFFFHILVKDNIFKKVIEHKIRFFLLTSVCNVSHYKKN